MQEHIADQELAIGIERYAVIVDLKLAQKNIAG